MMKNNSPKQVVFCTETDNSQIDDSYVKKLLEVHFDLGTSFKTSSVESIYNLKSYTKRPKDITDIQKLQPYINRNKLEELKKNPNVTVEYKNIKCSNHNKQR